MTDNEKRLAIALLKEKLQSLTGIKITLSERNYYYYKPEETPKDNKNYGIANKPIKDIDPNQIKVKPEVWQQIIDKTKRKGSVFSVFLEDLIDYPELFKLDPQIKWLPITFKNIEDIVSQRKHLARKKGTYRNHNGWERIFIRRPGFSSFEGDVKRTLVHEIQHYLQNLGGVLKNSNPETANDDKSTKYQKYYNSPKEVEARAAADKLKEIYINAPVEDFHVRNFSYNKNGI
jgi:hypothetical protein